MGIWWEGARIVNGRTGTWTVEVKFEIGFEGTCVGITKVELLEIVETIVITGEQELDLITPF